MSTRTTSPPKGIVRTPSQALVVRSAALVARGLRDLTRDSNWFIKKVFTGHAPHLAISPAGQFCAASPVVREGTERIVVYDIELTRPTLTLAVPGEPANSSLGMPAAFVWSSNGQQLIGAWQGWDNRLHAFDLHGKSSVGGFGGSPDFPRYLAWSPTGKYFACASGEAVEARIRMWESVSDPMINKPFAGAPLTEAGGPRAFDDWLGGPSAEGEPGDEGAFSAFGRIEFSPDETTLASVVEVEGEWADDSIVLLDVPTLRRIRGFQAQGRITGLAWTSDSRELIYCSAGQAYRIKADAPTSESLPFGAEIVACHPHLPVCLCFSSWLRSSAKGRLFLADLNHLTVSDEYPAEGVVDLRWSLDGSKAYAVTADGLAYVYEPSLL